MIFKKENKNGFTLTELLIAMLIIGIIAALTVPTMVRNFSIKEYEISISKFYTDLMQVGPLVQTSGGFKDISKSPYFIPTTENPKYGTRWVSKYLRVASSYPTKGAIAADPSDDEDNGGFATTYKSISQSDTGTKTITTNDFCTNGYTYILESNAVTCVESPDDNGKITIYVDTNGAEGPNMAGFDFFKLYMDISVGKDGTVDGGDEDATKCADYADATGCFQSVMDNKFKITYYK